MATTKKEDYRDSHKNIGKGKEYDDSFFLSNYKGYIYQWEKKILQKIWSSNKPSKYLDFACGTGRVTNLAKGYTSEIIGVDVSSSMLEVAKEKYPEIRFIEQDLTQSLDGLNQDFDAISTFRFFTNAQESLRIEAYQSLVKLLKPGGLLVFNLHMNSKSPFALMARLYEKVFGKRKGFNHIDIDYMKRRIGLLDEFEILEIHAKGFLPVIREGKIYPSFLFSLIDKLEYVLSVIPGYKSVCKYQIIVCKKKMDEA